jgi:peptidoglycan/LPS O-acetylase OafA/YrhL
MMTLKYRPDIDGLRAIAILPVVLNHATPDLMPGGFIGVDIFFVISGFLITSIIARETAGGNFSYFDFYSRRARRILPPLITVMGVTAIVASFIYLPQDFHTFWESAAYSSLFLANVFFLVKVDYFAAPMDTFPLLHLWSLAVEEQFYIVMPVLLTVVLRWFPRRLTLVVAACCAVSFLGSMAAIHWYAKGAFYLMPFRFWELGLGALLALATPTLSLRLRELCGALGAILLAASFTLIGEDTLFPGAAALAPCLGATLLLAAGPDTRVGTVLSLPPLVWIGLISYSLYLWHWPLLVFARYFTMGPLDPWQTAALIALSVLLATASLRWVEQPFRSHAMSALPPRQVCTTAAAVVVAFCALSAGALQLGDTARRFDPAALALLDDSRQRRFPDVVLCQKDPARDMAVSDACRIGPSGARPDFIGWGDSHMGAMIPGLEKAATDAGLTGAVIEKAACPPLLGIDRADMPFWHRCAAHNAQALAVIARERPRFVVLAARWAQIATGEGYGIERKSLVRFRGDIDAEGPELLRASLTRTLAAIRAAGAEPVIIGPVPEIGWDVGPILARAAQWGLTPPDSPLRAHYDARQKATLQVLRATAEGATIIDPARVLCDAQICNAWLGEEVFYGDDDHLSGRGSRLLSGALATALGGASTGTSAR